MDLEPLKRIGIAAAFKAGSVLQSHYGKITSISKKGAIDLSPKPIPARKR